MEIFTKSAQETQKLGQEFAARLNFGKLNSRNGAAIICLSGDLGSGKTTFIQGLARGLGITKRILSPTFVLMREYSLVGQMKFYHVDLYRIESPADVRGLGLQEIWDNQENIIAIEWPEKIKEILPGKIIELRFSYLDENARKIEIVEKK